MVIHESVLSLKTHCFEGIFCDIVIIFGGAYHYRRATCWKQITKYCIKIY